MSVWPLILIEYSDIESHIYHSLNIIEQMRRNYQMKNEIDWFKFVSYMCGVEDKCLGDLSLSVMVTFWYDLNQARTFKVCTLTMNLEIITHFLLLTDKLKFVLTSPKAQIPHGIASLLSVYGILLPLLTDIVWPKTYTYSF